MSKPKTKTKKNPSGVLVTVAETKKTLNYGTYRKYMERRGLTLKESALVRKYELYAQDVKAQYQRGDHVLRTELASVTEGLQLVEIIRKLQNKER
jgi:hypothetical protein